MRTCGIRSRPQSALDNHFAVPPCCCSCSTSSFAAPYSLNPNRGSQPLRTDPSFPPSLSVCLIMNSAQTEKLDLKERRPFLPLEEVHGETERASQPLGKFCELGLAPSWEFNSPPSSSSSFSGGRERGRRGARSLLSHSFSFFLSPLSSPKFVTSLLNRAVVLPHVMTFSCPAGPPCPAAALAESQGECWLTCPRRAFQNFAN